MPTIKTGKWLKEALKQKGLTQKELAKKAGLSVPAVSKIISGERFGSPETWDKINSIIGNVINLSVDSVDFIEELKEEIEIYGRNEKCNMFYVIEHGNIIFKDYLLPEDMAENYDDELKSMNMISITLAEALELFEAQDKIL